MDNYKTRGYEIDILHENVNIPIDVLDIIYTHMCAIKKISSDLKNEIVMYHRLFDIIDIYKIVFSLNKNDDNYYKFWLENDLICMLNDNKPTSLGISTNLVERYPNITVKYLNEILCADMLSRRISKLWIMLTDQQKQHMYQDSLLLRLRL